MVVANFDVAGMWDTNAASWARDVRSGKDSYRENFTFPAFASFLPSLEGLKIIDLGCGEGTNTGRIATMGARATGVDLSQRMIELAKESHRGDHRLDFRVASYTDLSCFRAGSFDAAISTLAFMDGNDVDRAMQEAHRIVKPGGFLAFSVLHPCTVTAFRAARDKSNLSGGDEYRYFDRRPFQEAWSLSTTGANDKPDLTVARFPRTLGDYLNAVANAGFVISRIDEPMPSLEACEIDPRLHTWRNYPFVLLVLATRP
jgi:SAM-dependent methyltransferase